MKKPRIDLKVRNSLLMILTAAIWGVAFVAQRKGGALTGPYTFNCIRSLIGAAVLVPVIPFLDRVAGEGKTEEMKKGKTLIAGGVSCGVMLFAASTLQQLGMYYGTTAGKAGFLTACYILLVPVLGVFLGRKCGWNVWVSVPVAVLGLYFICLTGGFSLQFCDMLVLLCAVCFSVQIMLVDHFSPLVDGVRMACLQFLTCGILGLVPMLLIELRQAGLAEWLETLGSLDAWIAILYAGVLSCGVAYTLQIVGQNGLNPTVASLLMSLESVFSALAGALLLREHMSGREIFGCALLFGAVLFAQINVGKRNEKVEKNDGKTDD
ncbi:MAG: DMT family transporter [Bacteroidales bacterium]|nr:DMT family transporter [Bacteroidales bacterium]MCM1414763.1 DMT family transporter [bacterium]MCM1423231.1 DMT family transporter [bacterium]